METRSRDNQQIFNEAAEWFVEFREEQIDAHSRSQFARWLKQSPEHIRAYLEVAAFWEDLPSLASPADVDIDALINYARKGDNVVPFNTANQAASQSPPDATPQPQATGSRPMRTRSRPALVAAGIALATLAASAAIYFQFNNGLYATDTGEQRSILLEDGSNVELNAKSRIRVHMTTQTREIELLDGQALFRVAPDNSRPFTVRTHDMSVRAIGTQFDVYRKDSGTTVSVVEGRVAVLVKQPRQSDRPADPEATTLLSAGDQVIVTAQAAVRSPRVDVPAVTAWTQRQIVFHATTLSEVCEQFNRYNRKQLIVEDPELQTVRVSGVFSTTDPTSLLRFLHERIQLVMTEKDGRIVISRK